MTIDVSVKDACNKLRSTFLSLVNCGIYEDGLNPLSVRRIYNAVVLPKALYGCELWSNIQSSHLVSLERAHRFCVKFMQFLPKSTSTDVALALFGFNSLETEIDYRKLIFLGQLCRLTGDHRVKTVFHHRLNSGENDRVFPRHLSYTYKICAHAFYFRLHRKRLLLVQIFMEETIPR